MGKFAERAKAPEQVETQPKTCGVEGCNGNADVIISSRQTARCSYHYQRDVDIYRGRRKSASSFVFDKGMPRL